MSSNCQSRHKNHGKRISKQSDEHVPVHGKRKKRPFNGLVIREQCTQTGESEDAKQLGRPEDFPQYQSSTRKGDSFKHGGDKDHLMDKCNERMDCDAFDLGKAINRPKDHGIHSPSAWGKSPASDEIHIVHSKRKRVEKIDLDPWNQDLGSSNDNLDCSSHETSIPKNEDSLLKVNVDSQKAVQQLNKKKCHGRRAKNVPSSSRVRMSKPISCRPQNTPDIITHANIGCGHSKATTGVDVTKSSNEAIDEHFQRLSTNRVEQPEKDDKCIDVEQLRYSVQKRTPAMREPPKESSSNILKVSKPPKERIRANPGVDMTKSGHEMNNVDCDRTSTDEPYKLHELARVCIAYGHSTKPNKLGDSDNYICPELKEKSLQDFKYTQLLERNEERQRADHRLEVANRYYTPCNRNELPPNPVLQNNGSQSVECSVMCGEDVEGHNGTLRQIPGSTCKSLGIEAIHAPNPENQPVLAISLPMKLPVDQILISLSPGQGLAYVPQGISQDSLRSGIEVPSIVSESPLRNNVHNVEEQSSDKIFHKEELNGMKWTIQRETQDVGESVVMEKTPAARTVEVDQVKVGSIVIPDLNMVPTSPSHDFQSQTFDAVPSSARTEKVPKERCEAVPRSKAAENASVEITTPNEDEPMMRNRVRLAMTAEVISNNKSDVARPNPNHFPISVQTEKISTEGRETTCKKAVARGIQFIERGNLVGLNTQNMVEDVNVSDVLLTNEYGGSNGYISRYLPAVSESADNVPSQQAASPLSNNLSLPDPVLQNVVSPCSLSLLQRNQRAFEIVPSHGPSALLLSASPPVARNRHSYAADMLKVDIELLQKDHEQHLQQFEATKSGLKSEMKKEALELLAQTESKYDAKFRAAEAEYLKEKQEIDRKLAILARNRALALASRSEDHGPHRVSEPLGMQGPSSSTCITLQLAQILPSRREPRSLPDFYSSRADFFSGFQQPTASRHPQNVQHSGALQSPFAISSSTQLSGFQQPTALPPCPPNVRRSGATTQPLYAGSSSASQVPSSQRPTAPPQSGPSQSLLASTTRFSGLQQPTALPNPQIIRQPLALRSSYTSATPSAGQVLGLRQPITLLSQALQTSVPTSQCPSYLNPALRVQLQNVRQSGTPHGRRQTRGMTPHGRSS